MANARMDEPERSSLRVRLHEAVPPAPHPGRLLHHPVIGLSLVLIAASAMQVTVWLVQIRVPPTVAVQGSTIVVQRTLYDQLTARLTAHLERAADRDPVREPGPQAREAAPATAGPVEPGTRTQTALFIICLGIAMSAALTVYAATRLVLGPSCALAAGVLWVASPSYAVLVQRPGPLILLIALIPLLWCLLIWWHQSGRVMAALLAGCVLGLLGLSAWHGILLAPLLLVSLLLLEPRRANRVVGPAALLAGWLVVFVPAWTWLMDADQGAPPFQQLRFDLWNALEDDADGSPMTDAARKWESHRGTEPGTPAPIAFLRSQVVDAPGMVLGWFARRAWQTLHATYDGSLQRPLFALHLLLLIPAGWGWGVALHHRAWRWVAVVAGLVVGVQWFAATVGEPLARNLVPVGGIVVLFTVLGVVDVYERFFGRRLTPRAEPSGP